MNAAQMPQVNLLLRRLGCRIDTAAPALFSSFSQTLRCVHDGERVLVKINQADPAAPATETRVLRALAGRTSAFVVPTVRAAVRSALALEWIDGSMLFTRRRAQRESVDVDQQVGWALAHFHASSQPLEALLKSRPRASALVDAVTWTSVETWASLSIPGRQLFIAIQADRRVMSALQSLRDDEHTTVVHGDFRHANILLRRRTPRIVILDWERAHLGPAASDLGMLLADELCLYLVPEPGKTIRAGLLRRRCRAIVQGYIRGREAQAQKVPKRFLQQCAQWTGLGLVNRVMTLVDDSHRASEAATYLFKHARWCLTQPHSALAFLVGKTDVG